MITREEAAALLAHAPDYWMAPGDGSIENVQGATIAHVHEHANLRTVDRTRETHSAADARLLAAAPDLARTVVALYDERDALEAAALEARGRLSEAMHELIAHRDNQRGALAAIHATAESAEKYAAKADALALELRRLRAAEAPGTDDAAFEGTGWDWLYGAWVHVSGPVVGMDEEGLWTSADVAQRNELALDAMRAAVPGSV